MPELPDHFLSRPSGETRISREVRAEHQRERVLARVTPVFAKRGYQGTTVDDLLAAGKVGVGNFYSLFEGKEDCFIAAFERLVTDVRGQMSESGAVDDWAERAYLGLRALLAAILEDPFGARLVLVEAQGAGEVAIGHYNAQMDAAVEWLREGREIYPAAAKLPTGFEQAAVSGLAFYLQACLVGSRRPSLEELSEETAGQLLGPIVGASELSRLRRDLSVRVV